MSSHSAASSSRGSSRRQFGGSIRGFSADSTALFACKIEGVADGSTPDVYLAVGRSEVSVLTKGDMKALFEHKYPMIARWHSNPAEDILEYEYTQPGSDGVKVLRFRTLQCQEIGSAIRMRIEDIASKRGLSVEEKVSEVKQPENEDVPMQGFLTKQGGLVKSWKQRWFVLKKSEKALYYFERPKDAPECFIQKGIISLEGARVEADTNPDKKFPNQFLVKAADRVYYLVAPTDGSLTEWIAAIEDVIALPPVKEKADGFFSSPKGKGEYQAV